MKYCILAKRVLFHPSYLFDQAQHYNGQPSTLTRKTLGPKHSPFVCVCMWVCVGEC